jgi:hypothetical protein
VIAMHMNTPRLTARRALTLALFWISSGILLSASSCIVQEPQYAPGQKLTWQQQHALDVKNYQELGDARRNNDRPCPPSSCK